MQPLKGIDFAATLVPLDAPAASRGGSGMASFAVISLLKSGLVSVTVIFHAFGQTVASFPYLVFEGKQLRPDKIQLQVI